MVKNIAILLMLSLVLMLIVFWIRPHSRLLLTLLPPSNLYEPIFTKEISLAKEGVAADAEFSHAYVGTYLVGAYMDTALSFSSPIDTSAVIGLSVRVRGTSVLHREYSRWTDLFLGGDENSGVILGYYKVPGDIPRASVVEVKLSVVTADPDFHGKYGHLTFFVRRKSDL